ncbi:MAG: hypothetical protein NPIRA03_26570 [Nitrospirales bacterium]|nr:MAG: hypothetical protein NPIRA03_26570 [Nitrospirales bacterium]
MTSLHKIFCLGAGLILLLVTGCYELPTEPVSEDADVAQPGFSGKVSGTVKTEISGPGVATYLRSQNTIDGVRSGYYLIANGRGAKDPLVTFRIPAGTKSGTYKLVAADPIELGENYEVQIESNVDGKLTSFGFNTEGTLTLESFPPDGTKLSGAKIKGSFRLVTEDVHGKSLSGKGTFEFLG